MSGPWPGLTRRQRVGNSHNLPSFFPKATLKDKDLRGSIYIIDWPLPIVHLVRTRTQIALYSISACRKHQPTHSSKSVYSDGWVTRQYDDGGSDLFMNSQ